MGTHTIQKVVPVKDAIDRLEWQARISTDFYGRTQLFAVHLESRISFYRSPVVPGNSMPGPQHPRSSLPARWTNRERTARMFGPGEAVFELATDLPGDALDRIEQFRDGGRLFARVEGKLFVLANTQEGWLNDLVQVLEYPTRIPCADVWSESFELTRDNWCREILAMLRPPGRYVVEFAVPAQPPSEGAAARAIDHLKEAQTAFDDGRYAKTARVCYRGLAELKKLGARVEERYGKYGKDRLLDQIKAIGSTCNPERHGDSPIHVGLAFDRALAQHVLASAWSIAGVVLR